MTQFTPGDLVRRLYRENAGVRPDQTFVIEKVDSGGWPYAKGYEGRGAHNPDNLELLRRHDQFLEGDLVRRTTSIGRQDAFKVAKVIEGGTTIIDDNGSNHYSGYLEHVPSTVATASEPERTAGEDVVHHPSHYKAGKFEAIEVIEAFDLHRDFRLGNAAKYLLRAGKKGDELQDVDKALKYLTRYREHLATGTPAW